MEFCNIAPGQKVKKKLTESETSSFIKCTAIPPHDRLQQIKNLKKQSNLTADPILKALNFTITDIPCQVKGRILPAPDLKMGDALVKPNRGVWDIQGKKLHNVSHLTDWAILNYDSYLNQEKIERFINLMREMGSEKGMSISEPYTIQSRKGEPNPEGDFYKLLVKDKVKLQMIMCILPQRKDIYAQIKQAGDVNHGVITQCVQSKNVGGCKPPTVSNILLKINAKLGGINNIFADNVYFRPLFSTPVMIMGADVNHPPASDKVTPSLAAVVASYDFNATKYLCEIRHQKHRTEIIMDLQQITKSLLIGFYKKTGRKPNRIIMYRDGVSETQFTEVLASEMQKMRNACLSLEKGYNPAITFLCVQKRHHTRLFCDPKIGVGKSKNIPPGTTVDSDITHPSERDFFLNVLCNII